MHADVIIPILLDIDGSSSGSHQTYYHRATCTCIQCTCMCMSVLTSPVFDVFEACELQVGGNAELTHVRRRAEEAGDSAERWWRIYEQRTYVNQYMHALPALTLFSNMHVWTAWSRTCTRENLMKLYAECLVAVQSEPMTSLHYVPVILLAAATSLYNMFNA